METWIRGIVAAAVGPIRDLAAAIQARLQSLYSTFTDALGRVRVGFGHWVTVGRPWGLAAIRHALVTYAVARWLITTFVPTSLGRLASDLEGLILRRVAALASSVAAALVQVQHWTDDLVRGALGALGQLRDYTLGRLAIITSALDRIEQRVFGVLNTPERLARWILAPLAGMLLAYALDNSGPIVEHLWRRRRRVEGQSLQWTSDMLDRIL